MAFDSIRVEVIISPMVLALFLLATLADASTTQPAAMGPTTRRAPASRAVIDPEAAYAEVMKRWVAGEDREAERLLQRYSWYLSRDQKFLFFSAVSERSRFSIGTIDRASHRIFQQIVKIDAESQYGRASAIAMELDHRRDVNENFAELDTLIENSRDDVLLLWLGGIMCREHAQNAQGSAYYERLLAISGGAPAIVHQTFANLLQDADRLDEALVQRERAVELKKASWTYDGLGDTLKLLHRFDEADNAYQEAIKLAPRDGSTWASRAHNFLAWKRPQEALPVALEGVKLDSHEAYNWRMLGWALEENELYERSAAAYAQSLKLDPDNTWAQNRLNGVVEKGGLDSIPDPAVALGSK